MYRKEEKTVIQNYFPSNLIKCSKDFSIRVVYGCQLKIIVNYFSLIPPPPKKKMSLAAIFIIFEDSLCQNFFGHLLWTLFVDLF